MLIDNIPEPLGLADFEGLLASILQDEQLGGWIMAHLESISPRWLKCLAAYYPDARVRRACLIQSGVELGEDTYPNYGTYALDFYNQPDPPKLLFIGARVAMGPRVTFVCDTRPNVSRLMELSDVRDRMVKTAPIVVEDDVWIGTGATILPGVRVGTMSIIGAHSLVREDVRPYTVVAGTPARVIRQLDEPGS